MVSDMSEIILKCVVAISLDIVIAYAVNKYLKDNALQGQFATIVSPDEISVSFDDVGGLEEIKDDLKFMVSLLKEQKEDINYLIPHGILLEGPPGNGKTMLAKALAHDAGVSFIQLTGSDFLDPFVGTASMRINSVFKKALEHAPCIIFIDELDAIGSKRIDVTTSVDKEENATLTTLLSNMDGFFDNSGIMVLAATNMASALDSALTRPGRFDKHYIINNPDYETRGILFKKYLKEGSYVNSIDINRLARMTYGFSCAQIKNVVNEAILISIKHNYEVLTEKCFNDAIMQLQTNGFERINANRSKQDVITAAYHEAGHAIVSLYCGNHTINNISIRPSTSGIGGYTFLENTDENDFEPLINIKNHIAVLYGGRAAEVHLNGGIDSSSIGSSQDISMATNLASQCITYEQGIDYSFFGKLGQETIMKYSRELLSTLWEKANSIISDNWNYVEIIANELIQYETISATRFTELVCKNNNIA